ncbi:ABC transporter substrate-binding protein [Parendozoicomonas sp. Alg238-R29]|uniref:substrate-binding periplasmic protein n=1 Tax=Parendozoicomonas sp. Alg238-R29 TaxID=2993446 RepID=UPI00248E6C1D|nr:ABC transporter substrate-binding protein [Parendozoicomonas sp. Alg238-R29]
MKAFSVVALLLGAAFTQANDRLTLLTESYPPFNMSIDDRNFARGDGVDGISTDIVREMMRRAGVEYTLTLRFPWSKVYNLTLNKANYGVFSTARSAEREDSFKWVGPIVDNDYVVFSLPGKKIKINNFEDMKKYKVGAYKDDYVTNVLKKNGVKVLETLKDSYNATKLKEGRIDLWASGSLSGPYGADQVGVTGLKQVYLVESKGLYLALNSSTPNRIVKKLQVVLDQMKSDGSVDGIYDQYR